MADIYLYVPCNGTRYYTSPNVASSTFAIYGADSLPSKKLDGKVCTYYDDRALIISNNTNNRLSWNYTVEWWQRNSEATSAAAAMMLSAGVDNTKLQLQDRVNGTYLYFTFENRFGAMGQDTSLSSNIANFNNGEWTHFAYVLDYSNARAYYFKNGVYVTGKTVVTPSTQPSEMYMLCVGGKSSSLSSAEEFFKGYLSDVTVYSGIKYQVNETFTPPTKSPDTTGLIAYGQESYTYIPKIQLFTENGQYKIHKFGRGGKAVPAPHPVIRVLDKDGNILKSIDNGTLNFVDRKQFPIILFAVSDSEAYVCSYSDDNYQFAKITSETGIAYTSGKSLLRTDGSIATYSYWNGGFSKSVDTRLITGAPTFKSALGALQGSVDVEGVGTDNLLYQKNRSSNVINTVGSTSISWDKITGCGYASGMSGTYIIASDMSKNIYLLSLNNFGATYLMSYTTNFITGWYYVQSPFNYIGLFIADGNLYAIYGSGRCSLLDDTQIWVDCTYGGNGGLALTSDGKIYTAIKPGLSSLGIPTLAQYGSETGWTRLGGGYDAFLAIKDGDIYQFSIVSGSSYEWSVNRLTYTGRYVDVAGGFRPGSDSVALAQEIVPSV